MRLRSAKRLITSASLRRALMLAGFVTLVALGVYLVFTNGIEPGLPGCSNYSPICLR